jgi:enoyl-CoA hydratase/carnithine racemase
MITLDKTQDGALWRVTLNRPDKANALTREMLAELRDIARAAAEAKVLVLTGAGKVFSAGADLEAARAGLATDPVWEELSGALAALPCFTIAALNGSLAGGAFGMALACDLRIAVPTAKFFYPVMKLGFLPQPSDPGRLAALVGPARAKLILMGGAKLSADEALDATVAELASDALSAAPSHIKGIKDLVG